MKFFPARSQLSLSILQIFFIFVGAEQLDLMRRSKQYDSLKDLMRTRHKRSAVSTLGPHINVHHYHYYYYCCPDMAARVRDDPQLAQALHNASCGTDKSSFYCQVPSSQQQQQLHPQQQQQHPPHHLQHPQQHQQHPQHHQQHPQQNQQQYQHPQQQQQHHPQQQHFRHDPFNIHQRLNDPIGRDFFDFITNNFERRDSGKDLGECLKSAFDDPICKDFFNFFNRSFVRKSDAHATRLTNVSTQAPLHTTQEVKSQQGNTQQAQKFRHFEDFKKVDHMFNELENDMKKTFAKTADLGKMLGIGLDDFR